MLYGGRGGGGVGRETIFWSPNFLDSNFTGRYNIGDNFPRGNLLGDGGIFPRAFSIVP